MDATTFIFRQSSYYCAFVMIFLCCIGIIGNLLSIYVFSQKQMRSKSINILLIGLSITDLLMLIFAVPIFSLPPLFAVHHYGSLGNDIVNLTVVYLYPCALMLQTASVWICSLICVERYIAVCRPLQVQFYCTVNRSVVALFITFLLAISYNFIRFWEFELVECDIKNDFHCNGNLKSVPLLRNRTFYWLFYGTGCYLLTHLLPCILLFVLNITVVLALYRAKQQRAALTSQETAEHRTALMMVIILVIFVLSYLMSIVLNIWEALDPELYRRNSTEHLAFLLTDVSNTLVVFNSATNSFIYMVFSYRYRSATLNLLSRMTCRTPTLSNNNISRISSSTHLSHPHSFQPFQRSTSSCNRHKSTNDVLEEGEHHELMKLNPRSNQQHLSMIEYGVGEGTPRIDHRFDCL